MKSIKHIALVTIVMLSIFGAVLYTSCSKDTCKGVTCLNGGTCSGSVCACPTGIGGVNCETVYRTLYSNGPYGGNATYSSNIPNDTAYIAHTDTNNTLSFSYGNDSNYTKMYFTWT